VSDIMWRGVIRRIPVDDTHEPVLPLTAIIPTYNRCPYGSADFARNPLVWCLYSLLGQRGSGLRHIVVVDDGSTDHTRETVLRVVARARGDIMIRYAATGGRTGPCHSRNIGLDLAATPYVFFMDDDCILAERTLAIIQSCHRRLQRTARVGALHLPVFLRDDTYERLVPLAQIGRLYPAEGTIFANFRCYPAEYAALRDDGAMAIALPIDFFQEVFLIEADTLREVGGFPATGFEAIHHEGLFLSMLLGRTGYAHYQVLHPEAYAIHFRYGSGHTASGTLRHAGALPVEDVAVSFASMVRESAVPREDTGGRAYPEQIVLDVIAGRYALFLELDPDGAERWARRSRRALLDGDDPDRIFRFPPLPLSRAERVDLWASALEKGAHVHARGIATAAGLHPGGLLPRDR